MVEFFEAIISDQINSLLQNPNTTLSDNGVVGFG